VTVLESIRTLGVSSATLFSRISEDLGRGIGDKAQVQLDIFDKVVEELDSVTARAKLAERQVAVLCNRIADIAEDVTCVGCQASFPGCCFKCFDAVAAWSLEKAKEDL